MRLIRCDYPGCVEAGVRDLYPLTYCDGHALLVATDAKSTEASRNTARGLLPVTHAELAQMLADLADASNQGSIRHAAQRLYDSGVERLRRIAKEGKE